MSGKEIDWQRIREILVFGKDQQSLEKRNQIWRGIDVNGNGYLSLAEIDKGLRDILRLDEIFDCKPAIMRAFMAAKNAVKTKSSHGPDYVERAEFRLLLLYLQQYFEYYQAFSKVDKNNDRKIEINEFLQAVPLMEKWMGKIGNPSAEFSKIDANGGGVILFDEFCQWAISRNLDMEDDCN